MSRNEKIINAFFSQNWFSLFKEYLEESKGRPLTSDDIEQEAAIACAFIWDDTREGHEYWSDIQRSWIRIYRSIE